MYNTTFLRNPWGGSDQLATLDELRKSIREQKVLLAAATGINEDDSNAYSLSGNDEYSSIEELKRRITSVSKEIHEKQQASANRGRSSTQSPAQWWARYQLNLRQMEDIADQRHALLKEINYLNSGMRSLQEELNQETETLNQCQLKAARVKKVVLAADYGGSDYVDTTGMTESERIRAKAQAMVSARLNKSANTSAANSPSLLAAEAYDAPVTLQANRIIDDVKKIQREVECIMETDMKKVDQELDSGTRQLKDRQMFEQGLYVNDYVARFIDQLDRSYNTAPGLSTPLPPPLSPSYKISSTPLPPPPIPTSQRPGTPRSAADIKAEAYRRIEERKKLFVKKATDQTIASLPLADSSAVEGPRISDEEKAAQKRMRQAETEARARLEAMREKRDTLRREAAEAEERKQKAAAQASAAAEAEMLAEKKRKQQEEEERSARAKKAQDEMAEKQRLELEAEKQRLCLEREERLRKEAEERKRREEEERVVEELLQNKAREAAEQAAREKRLRRMEIERQEREIEAARQEEINRQRLWEEAERQKRLEEERHIKEKEQEAANARKRLEEEEEARLQKKQRLEEEDRRRAQLENELRMKRRKEQFLEEKKLEEQKLEEEKRLQEQEKAAAAAADSASATTASFTNSNSTTAGNSGYGIDVEDEVNFSIIYRVKTLYEYQGIREDDLSFSANETLKAHPSKDKGSDWWYGTSLSTNSVGFFPRTYVEVVEEAFHVKTLYEFTKNRADDLGFYENEVIVVQPFQDESSDWWYGTNEDTKESGYFPKTYVEKIDSASNRKPHADATLSAYTKTIPIPSKSTTNVYTCKNNHLAVSDTHLSRGLSAPNTPMMKKASLGASKAELTKRRRAASSVSTANNSLVGTPQLLLPHSGNMSENLELLSWARIMDEIELNAIPADERKRQEAIFELISTERSYLCDLQMIINVFYTDSGKYLTQDERDVVFSNIDDLLICNTTLLSDLETRQREQANVIDNIGDVFLKHADNLQCYSTYCRNQSYATKFLQKKRENDQWFEVFLKTAQTRPECRSLDLSHFLLEPVQRITRYPLLLRQILNCTPKKHPDHALVKSALSIAQKVLEDVNEETRRFENIQKMSELSRIIDMEVTGRLDIAGREFIMDGALYKAKSGRKLHGFLFNDILLLAEPLKTLSSKGYLYTLYREPFPIESISVRQQTTITLKTSFGNNSDDLSFQIVSGNQVIAVKTSTAAQKRQWMSQIQHYSALQQYN
ncbi:hypothetical protein BD408DRAFT_368111 [Parasitella parasitica]|nr:hypothetical protein BD408DRAFT_368111 [Parasitella parasitica]